MLVLRSDGVVFTATAADTGVWPAGLEPTATVTVKGVCRVEVNPQEPASPQAFKLLLRTTDDVTVTARAQFWSPRRATEIFRGMGIVVVASLVWVLALRRRVERQTHLIGDRLDQEKALRAQYQELFENANDVVVTCDSSGRLRRNQPRRPARDRIHAPIGDWHAAARHGGAGGASAIRRAVRRA